MSDAQRAEAERLGVRVAFENHVGMRFVLIPAGKFVMGASIDDARRSKRFVDRPWPHRVRLTRPFYLQMTETTNASVRAVIPDWSVGDFEGLSCDGDRQPAIMYRSTAETFLAKVADGDPRGRAYRLPTEAEWELACRGGTRSDWYWGDQAGAGVHFEVLGDLNGRVREPGRATWPVASRKPNPYGLHDMLGNWFEWVADRYGPLPARPRTDPQGPVASARAIARLLDRHVVRGGAFLTAPEHARAWSRRPFDPMGMAVVRAVVPLAPTEDATDVRPLPLLVEAVRAENGKRVDAVFVLEDDEDGERRAQDGRFRIRIGDGRSKEIRIEASTKRVPYVHGMALNCFRPKFRHAVGAARLRYRIPLYRRARVEGQVKAVDVEPDQLQRLEVNLSQLGGPAETPFRLLYALAGSAKPDAAGRFHLPSVPWIPGAPITVRAVERGTPFPYVGTARGVLPTASGQRLRLQVEVALLESKRRGGDRMIGLGEGGEGPPIKFGARTDGACGSVDVRCLRPDGLPLEGAVIIRDATRDERGRIVTVEDVAVTDASGTATFPDVPEGTSTFEQTTNGIPLAPAVVEVGAGCAASVAMRVPRAARLSLTVKRAEGGPAAYADVTVDQPSGSSWVDLEPDGTLHVEPTLGPDGSATLHNLEPGALIVRIAFFGRVLEHQVRLSPGQEADLHLELPRAEGWRPGR